MTEPGKTQQLLSCRPVLQQHSPKWLKFYQKQGQNVACLIFYYNFLVGLLNCVHVGKNISDLRREKMPLQNLNSADFIFWSR